MEETQWNNNSSIPGNVNIEIQGLGSFGCNQPLRLIDRVPQVYTYLTGRIFRGSPEEIFELVSADPQRRKVVYKIKPEALRSLFE